MKRIFFFVIIYLLFFVSASWGEGAEETPVLEKMDNGTVNWTAGVIQANGMTVPFKKDTDKSIDSDVALTAAKASAYHYLFETIKKIRINSRSTLETSDGEKEGLFQKMDAFVRNAEITKQKYLSDGTLEITMQLDMHGAFTQLVLPPEIKQLETIKQTEPIGQGASASNKTEKSTSVHPKKEIYSGLILDTQGLAAQPAMVPKVMDENGKEVFGPTFASREFAVQSGMSGYASALEHARNSDRTGRHPLIVKGLSTEGPGGSNLVISNADAAILRGASEHLKFLRECRVTIVIYPPQAEN